MEDPEAALLFEQFYRKAELLFIHKYCNGLLFYFGNNDGTPEKTRKSKRKYLLRRPFRHRISHMSCAFPFP